MMTVSERMGEKQIKLIRTRHLYEILYQPIDNQMKAARNKLVKQSERQVYSFTIIFRILKKLMKVMSYHYHTRETENHSYRSGKNLTGSISARYRFLFFFNGKLLLDAFFFAV